MSTGRPELKLVGYQVNDPGGAIGGSGTGYTYVLAGNGLFLEAENQLLVARIMLATAPVRGLSPLEPLLELKHGRISGHLLSLVTAVMVGQPDREMYAAITWEETGYSLRLPQQEGDADRVTYEAVARTVASIHSHGRMGAFFSSTDDADDQGFLVSVVLGELGHLTPQARARLCVYGYFAPVDLRQVFEDLPSALEEVWSTN